MSSAPPASLADDPRVYFNKESNTWRYEEDDGTEMEYDAGKGAWLPLVDEDLMKQQQAAYSVSGVDEEASRGHSIKRGKQDKKDKPATERKSKNTAIYVTGLPLDTEFDEVVTGDDGEPKVKMYARDDGSFSGEALVVYFKEDSVILALNILDESELRLGDPNSSQPRKTVDKKKASRRIGKMQQKLQEWNDEDGFGPSLEPEETVAPKTSRAVVLKHIGRHLLLDLKEDVRDECSSLGEVTNVVLYDKEEDGIMTVKFRDPVSAQACVLRMNGRFFSGRRIEASLYFGKQRFRRSGTGDEEGTEEERLAAFSQFLMDES
ncbi:hypothetical protein CPB85DRAFT_1378315 [Mucidula mucida]|nr:hypothetical protein CPB85DRAFT_1378315 [Mucidula mucida]